MSHPRPSPVSVFVPPVVILPQFLRPYPSPPTPSRAPAGRNGTGRRREGSSEEPIGVRDERLLLMVLGTLSTFPYPTLVMSAVSRRVTRLPSASGLSPLRGVEREEACNQGSRRQEMCKVKVDRAHLSHVVSLISFQSSRSTFILIPFHFSFWY